MVKIKRYYNLKTGLIFILIEVFLSYNFAYSYNANQLRAPLGAVNSERVNEVAGKTFKDAVLSIVNRVGKLVQFNLFRNQALFVTGIKAEYQKAVLEAIIPPSDDVVFIDLKEWVKEWEGLDDNAQYIRLMKIDQYLIERKTLAMYGYGNNKALLDLVGCLRSRYNMMPRYHRVVIIGEDSVDPRPYGVGFLDNSPFYNYPIKLQLRDNGIVKEYDRGRVSIDLIGQQQGLDYQKGKYRFFRNNRRNDSLPFYNYGTYIHLESNGLSAYTPSKSFSRLPSTGL